MQMLHMWHISAHTCPIYSHISIIYMAYVPNLVVIFIPDTYLAIKAEVEFAGCCVLVYM